MPHCHLKRVLLIVLCILFSITSEARENFYGIVYDKYDKKKKVSWNLSDWLTQKSNSASQDLWLAMNTSATFFEFYLYGAKDIYTLEEDSVEVVDEADGVELYRIGLFASIFGIEGEMFKLGEDLKYTDGRLTLRLFGKAVQGTNILLFFGQRNREEVRRGYTFDMNYYGASLNLYLLPILGLSGEYRSYLEAEPASGIKVEGNFTSYGAFVDLSFVRIVYESYIEKLTWTPASGVTNANRAGQRLALQLFF